MKSFNNLDKESKNNLRKEYKKKYQDNYNYSINLFIIYATLGFFSVIGLFIMPYNSELGYIMFIVFFFLMLIALYFLHLSNNKFKKFLKKKGYKL